MSFKHLHELLQEDQEPFHFNDYIANHRYQLKSSTTTTTTTTDTTIFLHVPTMLRDAAMRVHQQSSTKNIGLFGSLFKRLKHKSTQNNHHVTNFHKKKMIDHNVSGNSNVKRSDYEIRFPHSCNNSRVSSEDWSEKVSESETTCSPSSPFRFCLLKSPSFSCRTPDILSPAISPSCFFGQVKDKQPQDDEQCSPVSVLHDDFERSYSSIQRTKNQLLEKLLRFERLVELDPTALERHILEQCYKDEHDDDHDHLVEKEEDPPYKNDHVKDIMNHLSLEKFPSHVKRLALDLTVEENKNEEQIGRETVVKSVCGRLDSWRMVESKAIAMMVEFEFRSVKSEEWQRWDGDMVREIGMHIEVAIFEELVQDLVSKLGINYS